MLYYTSNKCKLQIWMCFNIILQATEQQAELRRLEHQQMWIEIII